MPAIPIQIHETQGPLLDVMVGRVRRDPAKGNSRRRCRALIDTGAEFSMIDDGMAQELGLETTGNTDVLTPNSPSPGTPTKIYLASLVFEHPLLDTELPTRSLRGGELADQGFTVLIGRDLLNRFAFMYDGPGGTALLCL